MYSAILTATFITVQQLICDSSQFVGNPFSLTWWHRSG